MRNKAAVIVDRLKLKRQINTWRVLSIALLVMMILVFFSNANKVPATAAVSNYVARVHIDGPIVYDMHRIDVLKQIEENNAIKAVIVHINSPGGTTVGGETLYDSFRKISNKKPVVTVMGDIAASGGYMAAMATDYLIAHQTTITGSIGVIMQAYEFSELADKVGVKFNTFKSSPVKGGPIPTEPITPQMRKEMMSTLTDINDLFKTMVQERRKLNEANFKEVTEGSVFTGRQALMNGLIDSLGDEETALAWLHDVKKIDKNLAVRTIELEYMDNKFNKLFNVLNHVSSLSQTIHSLLLGVPVAM